MIKNTKLQILLISLLIKWFNAS